jgi:hypothetical protein
MRGPLPLPGQLIGFTGMMETREKLLPNTSGGLKDPFRTSAGVEEDQAGVPCVGICNGGSATAVVAAEWFLQR